VRTCLVANTGKMATNRRKAPKGSILARKLLDKGAFIEIK
jgi:hypothetical protein